MQNRPFPLTVLTGVLLVMAAGTATSFAQEKAEPAAPEKTDQPEAPAKPEPSKPAAEEKAGPAYELLNSAVAVIRDAKSLKYTAKSFGTESMESMSPRTTAQVWMLRDPSGTWLLRAKGSGKDRSGADQEFDVAWRRETVEFLDHKEKKVYERRTREARSSALQIASASRVADLVGPNPYNTLVSAQTLELEDRQSIDGVDCDVLLASSGTKKSKSRWYFGVEDHLPRKVEKIIEGDKIAGMIVVEFSAFTVSTESAGDPAVTPEQVRVEVPAAYATDRYQPKGEQDSKPAPISEAEAAKAAEQAAAAPNPFLPGPPPKKDPNAKPPEMKKGEEPHAPTPDAPTPAVVPPTTPPPQPAPPATPPSHLPTFELTSAAGVKVNADSLKGSVAVIDFFGSWMPGKTWQPTLDAAIKDLKDVKIFAASVREKSAEAPAKALKDRHIAWDHLAGADQLAKDLGIKLFPATVVVGKNGEIVEVFQNCRGEETAQRIKTAIENASK